MTPTITPIDFSQTPLASSYSGFYAVVIDDVFTPDECFSLLSLATSASTSTSTPSSSNNDAASPTPTPTPTPTPVTWTPAALSAENPTSQTVHTDFRNSDRILHFDTQAAGMIYERLRPFIQDEIGVIQVGGKWEGVTGKKGRKQGGKWELAGVNDRLSFLRYEPGHYFKPHCDGLNDQKKPDGTILKSFITLHLYLNGPSSPLLPSDPQDSPSLIGGSTRFWSSDKKSYLDVEPKQGRVLIFQQRMLIHSGEEVKQGIKYTMRSDFMFRAVT